MKFVSYVAVEGLGNRLRTHCLAHAYAIHSKRKLVLDWTPVKAFGVKYGQVFDKEEFIEPRHNVDKKIFEVLKKHFSHKFNNRLFDDDQDVTVLPDTNKLIVLFGEASNPWSHDNDGISLGAYKQQVVASIRPKSDISAGIEHYLKFFSSRTVGIHMRRGDFDISFPDKIVSVRKYMRIAEKLMRKHNSTTFFVASDEPKDVEEFQREFPTVTIDKKPRNEKRSALEVFEYENKCNRDTLYGAKEAVMDLFLLSKTNLIIGSPNSSFSKMAALLGNTELVLPESHEI